MCHKIYFFSSNFECLVLHYEPNCLHTMDEQSFYQLLWNQPWCQIYYRVQKTGRQRQFWRKPFKLGSRTWNILIPSTDQGHLWTNCKWLLVGYNYIHILGQKWLASDYDYICSKGRKSPSSNNVFESQKYFVTMFSSMPVEFFYFLFIYFFFFYKPRNFMVFMSFGPRPSFYEKSSGVLPTTLTWKISIPNNF